MAMLPSCLYIKLKQVSMYLQTTLKRTCIWRLIRLSVKNINVNFDTTSVLNKIHQTLVQPPLPAKKAGTSRSSVFRISIDMWTTNH